MWARWTRPAMLDAATLAKPPIRGCDLDAAQRLVMALEAVADLVDAAGDLHAVRPDRLSCLITSLTDPLSAELEALAKRAEGAALPAP